VCALVVSAVSSIAWPADAASPLGVQIGNCEPWQEKSFSGYGNNPLHRKLRMRFAYHKTAANDSPAAAIAATERIEVCRVKNGVTVQCPGSGAWVLYDKNDPQKQIAPSWVFDSAAACKPLNDVFIDLPVDWDDASQANDFFIVHVTDAALSYFGDATTYGFCANWRRLASGGTPDRFHVHGVAPQKLFGTLDPCTAGAKMDWQSGGPPVTTACGALAVRNGCLGSGLPEWIRGAMASQDESHFNRLQFGIPEASRQLAWQNGQLNGVHQATRVFAGPHYGGVGNAGRGAFALNVDTLHPIKPALDPVQAMATDCAKYSLAVLTHEYFHQLEIAWAREHPSVQAHVEGLLHEALPASMDENLCLKGFPNSAQLQAAGDPRWECVSAGKVGHAGGGVYAGRELLANPQLDAVAQYYPSALFLRYVQEQFSYPVGSEAHLLGSKPSAVVNVTPHGEALADRQFSDEGIDFLGHLFAALAGKTGATTKVLNQTLVDTLGRDLDGVVRDFHTAMLLKDYADTDARWRFVWTNRDGYFALSKLGSSKPFAVPPDLYGDTCGWWSCDGLTRARRVLDSWEKGPSLPGGGVAPAVRKLFELNAGASSAQPTGLGVRGAAYLSVSPKQPDWTGKNLAFRAEVPSGAAKPKFRIYRVDQTAPGQYVPHPVCGVGKLKTCSPTNQANGMNALNKNVALNASTVEVLAVASAGSSPAKFTWSVGALVPKLSIIEPTKSMLALAGTKAVPRKFAVKLSYRDQLNQPVALPLLDKSEVEVFLHGCQVELEGGQCKLPPQYVQPFPISGGSMFLVVQTPAHFYPLATASGALDLEVRLVSDGVSATSPGSVRYGPDGLEAVVLASDRSLSMAFPPTKLTASQIAAKALVRSFVPTGPFPTTMAGLVFFAADASTAFSPAGLRMVTLAELPVFDAAIDSVLAPGLATSIGDGLLESQSILAATFDNNPLLASAFERHSVVVLSDGVNTADATPWHYYAEFPTGHTADGNGAWYPSPLSRKHREAAGLTTPVVSAIAIGQDADLSELDHLSRVSGGTLTYVEGDAAGLAQATIAFADAMFEASGTSRRHQRISGKPVIAGESMTFAVEPGTRELGANVVSGLVGGGAAELRAPSGAAVAPTASGELGYSTSFRVTSPEPGVWTLGSTAVGHPAEPIAFAEAKLDSPTRLFVQFDVDDVTPLGGGPAPVEGELDAWQGSELALRAVVIGDTPIAGCEVTAEVTHPDGTRATVALADDGEHDDGEAGDGLFARVYARTAQAGLYRSKIRALCADPGLDLHLARESTRGVTLGALPDLNADGVPDRWAALHGITVTPFSDADADELTDVEELQAGTDPGWSDSDGGGESDGSEVRAGRDPKDPSDDLIDAPAVMARAGDGAVFLPASLFLPGVTLRAERAPAAAGPFSPISTEGDEAGTQLVDRAAPNDRQACYRLRADKGTVSSAWSPVSCVTPRRDPVPPRVRLADAPKVTHSRDVDIRLSFADPPRLTDGLLSVDVGGEVSGVEAMRVWFGADQSGQDVPWQPVAGVLSLRLPDQDVTSVVVQARDAAGNVSAPLVIGLWRPLRTCLDRAIAAEQRAEDAVEAGDLPRAKLELATSLPFIEDCFVRALNRLKGAKSTQNADAAQVVLTLAKVRGRKLSAAALLKPQTLHLGRSALREAIELEVGLAGFADQRGISL
jgi:hypothetical protein